MIGDDCLGKIMVLMFDDNEEDVFHHIMCYVKAGAKSFTFMDAPILQKNSQNSARV